MEENPTVSPAKSSLQLGVLFGILMVLEFIIMYVIGMEKLAGTSAGIIANTLNYFVLPVTFIAIGVKNYKKANQGFASFSDCLKIGVSIAAIAALIYAVFYLIFNMIFPEFTGQLMDISKTQMLKQNPDMTQDQIDTAMSMMSKFMSPYIIAPFTIVIFTFIGLIYSLIIGAIAKKDRPTGF